MMNLFGGLSSLRCCDQGTSAGTVVQSLAHINPLVVQKILARIMLSEMKTSRLFLIFLLSSCDVVTWKAGRRRVASRWLLNFFFLNSNDYLDAVLSTDLGEQRCFKFLIRQFLSLNKTKIICSVADRKRFVACGFCGVRI